MLLGSREELWLQDTPRLCRRPRPSQVSPWVTLRGQGVAQGTPGVPVGPTSGARSDSGCWQLPRA